MSTGWKVKFALCAMGMLLALWFVVPNILDLPQETSKKKVELPWYAKILPDSALRLGLDLQGGVHLVLGVDLRRVLMNEADQYAQDLRSELPKNDIPVDSIVRARDGAELRIRLKNSEKRKAFEDYIRKSFNVLQIASRDSESGEFKLNIVEDRRLEIERDTIRQALETLRNRLDEFGVAEPSIAAKGNDRIVVQLPGLDDPERAKNVVGKTAQLEFKLVDDSVDGNKLQSLIAEARKTLPQSAKVEALNLALDGKIPDGTMVLMQEDRDPTTGNLVEVPFLLKVETLLTGEMLETARTGFGQYNEPTVNLQFNARGAEIFEKVTGENVKKRLAIVLDDRVQSAPVIQDRIAGGNAQITFGSSLQSRADTLKEAKDLALILRAGALPAPVEILENRAVGPSLGRDSIEKGFRAMLFGAALVFFFMFLYYRGSGLLADAALFANILFILAGLGAMNATLTLPGIAGIIISVGMAVDANILVFERIREELLTGKSLKAAVEAGYERAHVTILDSNLTTIITGVVLLQFGTGPIKGFAVTLILGLIANYFTAVWFTRIAYEWFLFRFNPQRLSI